MRLSTGEEGVTHKTMTSAECERHAWLMQTVGCTGTVVLPKGEISSFVIRIVGSCMSKAKNGIWAL